MNRTEDLFWQKSGAIRFHYYFLAANLKIYDFKSQGCSLILLLILQIGTA